MDLSPAYVAFMCLAAGVFVLARRCFPTRCGSDSRRPATRRRGRRVPRRRFGAKLPFVAGGGEGWLAGMWLADGKTVSTGLVGAYLGVELAKRLVGVRAKTGDGFALPLALALAVGRWGCYFHGCCHGRPTDLPWAADFGDGVGRHPTQAYESLFHLALVGCCWPLFGGTPCAATG